MPSCSSTLLHCWCLYQLHVTKQKTLQRQACIRERAAWFCCLPLVLVLHAPSVVEMSLLCLSHHQSVISCILSVHVSDLWDRVLCCMPYGASWLGLYSVVETVIGCKGEVWSLPGRKVDVDCTDNFCSWHALLHEGLWVGTLLLYGDLWATPWFCWCNFMLVLRDVPRLGQLWELTCSLVQHLHSVATFCCYTRNGLLSGVVHSWRWKILEILKPWKNPFFLPETFLGKIIHMQYLLS